MKFDISLNNVYALSKSIDSEIIVLADILRNRFFSKAEQPFLFDMFPSWIMDAGHSPECGMSKNIFEKIINKNKSHLINKLLYYYDCDALLFGLQNRFSLISTLMEEVYKQLSRTIDVDTKCINAIRIADSTSIHTHTCMNSIFINLASSCDLMTKIAIELELIPTMDFSTYPKMKSSNIQYGNKCKLPDTMKKNDTYFAEIRPVPIAIIETLRDEIIHNGSLDINYFVYSAMIGDSFIDFIPCPDFTEAGTFSSFNGRKKFYENCDKTFNEELPKIVDDFLKIAINTLQLLNKTYFPETQSLDSSED
jgi:hypothetical protein